MDELAIRVENVTKEYRLGMIGGGTLKGLDVPKVDLLGRRRVQGLKIDIGAIEGDSSGLTVLVR